jgi:NADPH-dependent 2,4-dienoyl-CoA reductase/sulfur reductase-like enzyme
METGPGLYHAFADPELSGFIQRLLESRGVVVKTNARVSRFRAEGGKLAGVTTEASEQIPADVAVIGVGAEPITEWLANSGFQIERGGVVVNVRLETQGSNVWAAGDIARFPDPVARQPRRLEHWDNALSQGKQAGRNMAGAEETYTHQSLFFSDIFNVTMNVLGETERPDRVVLLGSTDVAAPHFTVYYVRAHKLIGAVMVNLANEDRTAEFEALQKHLTDGTTPEI